MSPKVFLSWLCLLVVCLAGLAAHAQDTGGSMGGSGFSGGSSSSSSESSSSSGSSSGSSGDSSGSYSSGRGSGRGSGSGLVIFVVIGGLMFLSWLNSQGKGSGARPATSSMVLSSLVLGIDWNARRELQAALATLAARKLGGTAEGRAEMLREVVLALQRAERSWLYAAQNSQGVSATAAEPRFRELCHRARSRFRREVIRSEDGGLVTEAAPPTPPTTPIVPRPEEGAGTVVVSLILVTWRSFAETSTPGLAAQIRAGLADRATLTSGEVVAIEIVWSPAAEEDRMSTAELEANYPELKKLDPKSLAGRIFCAHCGGAFAQELLGCPHCGAAVGREG